MISFKACFCFFVGVVVTSKVGSFGVEHFVRQTTKTPSKTKKNRDSAAKENEMAVQPSKEVNPDQVIPFDDEGFTEF